MTKKRLYISDLDGTLLNSKVQIPDKAAALLSGLIKDHHIHFSIATARTPATVEILLQKLPISIPVILMNGTVLYDMQQHSYRQVEYISESGISSILRLCKEELDEGFIYTINEDKLVVYYEDLTRPERKAFFDERQNLKYKKFVKGKPLSIEGIAYFVFIDTEDKINSISEKLEAVPGIAKVAYKDIYSDEGWILEIYSEKATKANGIKKLRALGGYDEIVCFGDNLNDLSMFECSDRAYAVSNAVEALKEQADGVIGSCEEGSVAAFIAEDIKRIDQHTTKDK